MSQQQHSRPTSPRPAIVVVEENFEARVGDTLGITKWFSAKLGFGFITVHRGSDAGKDIFVHHTGIRPLNSNYKTLVKGEYVNFDIIKSPNGDQAVNVTGVQGGPLMCDHVPYMGSMACGHGARYGGGPAAAAGRARQYSHGHAAPGFWAGAAYTPPLQHQQLAPAPVPARAAPAQPRVRVAAGPPAVPPHAGYRGFGAVVPHVMHRQALHPLPPPPPPPPRGAAA